MRRSTRGVANHVCKLNRSAELTEHQIEIVRCLLNGASVSEAARIFQLSPGNVANTRDLACDRMRVGHFSDLRKYIEGKSA